MKKTTFLKELADVLEIDDDLAEESDLRNFPEYDSLGVMCLIAYIDEKFGINLSSHELARITTVKSLIKFIGDENFD